MRKKHHHKKSSSFTKKWSAKLHLWFGLSVGLIVFIVSLSGTMYVFKDEIQHQLRKEAMFVNAETITQKPLSIEILKEKVTLEVNEKYPVSSVEIPLARNRSYEFLYYEKDKKAWNYFDEVKINKLVYVNPYTGEILGIYNEKYDLFPILKSIHWSLLLKTDWGKYVVGIPVVLFIMMLITGIVLWWPKNKKARKGRFWFDWKNVKSWKRKNYDLHNVLGFYASFIALLMSITGIYFAYPWVKNTFNLALSGSAELPKEKEMKSPDSLLAGNNAVFDLTARETRQLYAESSSFRIPLNGKNKKGKPLSNIPVTVYGEDGRFAMRNQLAFDKYSGKLLLNKPHQKLNTAEKYAHANYDIHTGSYFGIIGKIIWFMAGLICTSLPVTGFLVWLGKRKKKSIMKKIVLSVAALAAITVTGQQKDSLQVKDVDEVVLTASRKKESIKEVPSSVTIVSQKQIQSQLTVNSDITNILQYTVPSLAPSSGMTTNSGQTLRGRQVLVLIDGIPQSTPLRNGSRDIRSIDPSVIERIEVIKGATSIYGNGSDGGIINYITKKAGSDRRISGQSQVGITGQLYGGTLGIRASQFLTGKITPKFDYAASLAYERTGYMKDADGISLSPTSSTAKMDNYNGMLKLGYNLNDNQRIEASYIGYASKSDLDLGLKTGKYGITPTIGEGSSKNQETTPQGTPRNHNLKISYDNRNLWKGTALNINLYLQDFRTVYGYSDTFLNGGQSNVISKKKGARFNFDTQLWNTRNSQGEVIYGADILNDKTVQKLEDGRYWTPDMDMTNIAPFMLVKIDLFKKLILKGGLRYENIKVKVGDFNTLSTIKNDGTFTKSIFVKGGDLEYNALVGNIGFRYNFNPQINLFGSFSQSYSINELGRILRTSTADTINKLETKPIIVNNYELGATGQITRWLNYEITSYVSTSKLGATFVQSPDRSLMIQRAPEVVYGVEGFLQFSPAQWISFGGSYSWIEGITSPKDDGDYSTKINNSRISAPKVLAYVQVRPVRGLSVGLDMLHAFEQNRFQPNAKTGLYTYGEGRVPEYTVFNFKSSYEINKSWRVSGGIENLFNRSYQPAIAWWAARDSDFVNALGTRGTLMVEYRF